MKEKKKTIEVTPLLILPLLILFIAGFVVGMSLQKNADARLIPEFGFSEILNRDVLIYGDRSFVEIKIWEMKCIEKTEVPDEWKEKLAM